MARNAYARPRSSRSAQPALPPVEEHPYQPRFAIELGADYGPGNPAAWTVVYRCRRRGGRLDEDFQVRKVIAASRQRAIRAIQEHHAGGRVEAILLCELHAPPSRAELEDLERINGELQREYKYTTTHR